MSDDRRMDWLWDRQVITSCLPWSDKPTETYDWGWYYEHGTYQKYDLFWYSAKIHTIKSLKWHIMALRFLNPEMEDEKFERVINYICDIKNNFIIFTPSQDIIDSLIASALNDSLDTAPPNKLRKVIFRHDCGLDKKEKMSIVGKLMGKSKFDSDKLELVMTLINERGDRVTNRAIAKELGLSERTIQRALNERLKHFRDELNRK